MALNLKQLKACRRTWTVYKQVCGYGKRLQSYKSTYYVGDCFKGNNVVDKKVKTEEVIYFYLGTYWRFTILQESLTDYWKAGEIVANGWSIAPYPEIGLDLL